MPCVAAGLAACVATAPPAAADARWLEAGRAFRPPIADPRETRTGIDYVDGGFWSLRVGQSITIARFGAAAEQGLANDPPKVATRVGIDGSVWLWFEAEHHLNFPLQMIDGSFGVWLERARGPWSGRLRLGHISSHHADGFDPARDSVVYSREWVAALVAHDASPELRLYAGPGAWVRADPKTRAFQFQAGGLWHGSTSARGFRPFFAFDARVRSENGGRVGHSILLGLERPGGPGQTLRFALGYSNGFSERGQDWRVPERHFTLGLSFSD